MIENRLITGRPTLTIDEAIEMGKCTVADLFYQAEIGNLIVYYIAKAFRIGSITEIDSSIDVSTALGDAFYRGPELPKVPLPDDKDFEEKCQEIQTVLRLRDLVDGNAIKYGRGTKFEAVYEELLDDTQPISAATFKDYRIEPRMASIELHLKRTLPLSEEVHDLFVRPDPEEDILVQDALDEGKLVVREADIKRLIKIGHTNPDDAKPDGGVSRKTLLKLIIGMAKGGYGYDPKASKNTALSAIVKDLEVEGAALDPESIRKALKEAATSIPRKAPET